MFYKVRAMVGHKGAGLYGELDFYVVADSVTNAIKKVRYKPQVKHTKSLPLTSVTMVDEREFVVCGCVMNPYAKTSIAKEEVFEYHKLEEIAGKMVGYQASVNFETEEGKKLLDYSKKYLAAKSVKEKAQINRSYNIWAGEVLQSAENE